MKPFWESKVLAELSATEWESLCDGCGKCCLQKLQDEDSNELYFTNVACRYLNTDTCRCRDYSNRQHNVPECIVLRRESAEVFEWLPSTCAYRLLWQNKPLPDWHPLVCGSTELLHQEGHSVQGRVFSEEHVHPEDLEDHIVNWVESEE
ncbi:hypothetical protein P886_4085 [Alteromonadaceae bacterium 2753L.S.0a.02]|nr:hypothetical protein P886_4085 [Alteromonadaceae bacterium 2753L.S.0a.02]